MNTEYYALVCKVTGKIIDLSLGKPSKNPDEYIQVNTDEAEKAILYMGYSMFSDTETKIENRNVAWGQGRLGAYTRKVLLDGLIKTHPERDIEKEYNELTKQGWEDYVTKRRKDPQYEGHR